MCVRCFPEPLYSPCWYLCLPQTSVWKRNARSQLFLLSGGPVDHVREVGYLKAVWPDLLGCVFEVWPAPGAREGPQKCGGLADLSRKEFAWRASEVKNLLGGPQ